MKRIYTTLAIASSLLIGASRTYGQTIDNGQECTLLTEEVEGDYMVRRYKVIDKGNEAEYSLKYSIDAAKLPALTVGNVAEMVELDEMVAKIKQDSAIHLSRIEITGYASPDGNATSNERLAMSRAEQFRTMLEERYSLPTSCEIVIKADAEPWSACDKGVEDSTIGDKERVLQILNSSASESSKEQQLKALPSAWSIFRTQILPSMRRVEMTAYYTLDKIIEVRTLIEKPQEPTPPTVVQRRCPCEGFIDDMSIGIVVDLRQKGAIY